MTDPFDTPAPTSGGIDLNSHIGALLLIDVHAQEQGIVTAHGLTDPIRADIAVLDGNGEGLQYEDTLIFPKVLIGQLKRAIGKKVLGRLGQGEKKPGQSPPWILADPTEADRAIGLAYLSNGFAAPPAPQTGAKPPF